MSPLTKVTSVISGASSPHDRRSHAVVSVGSRSSISALLASSSSPVRQVDRIGAEVRDADPASRSAEGQYVRTVIQPGEVVPADQRAAQSQRGPIEREGGVAPLGLGADRVVGEPGRLRQDAPVRGRSRTRVRRWSTAAAPGSRPGPSPCRRNGTPSGPAARRAAGRRPRAGRAPRPDRRTSTPAAPAGPWRPPWLGARRPRGRARESFRRSTASRAPAAGRCGRDRAAGRSGWRPAVRRGSPAARSECRRARGHRGRSRSPAGSRSAIQSASCISKLKAIPSPSPAA